MEIIHSHVILIQTMRHLIDAKSRMFELIRHLLRMASDGYCYDVDSHYVTIVGFNNNTHKIYWDFMNLSEVRDLEEYLFSQLEFDQELAYYRYGCGFRTLHILMNETVERMKNTNGKASFHVITDGIDNLLGIKAEEVCRQMLELEEMGWDFSFYCVDRVNYSICKRDSVLVMFRGSPFLMIHASLMLKRLKREVKGIPEEKKKIEIKEEQMMVDQEYAMVVSCHDKDASFSLDGVEYSSFRHFCTVDKDYKPEAITVGLGFYVFRNKKGQLILEYSRLYPCFDSYDYINENRFHRNYWVCKDENELLEKYDYITKKLRCMNDDYSSCPMPSFLGPAVFYDDGSEIMKIGL